MDSGFWAGPERIDAGGGRTLRLLSAREVLEARREGDVLARDDRERALCRNACLVAKALDQEEELERLCPDCRQKAAEEPCPVCGAPRELWAVNAGFDWARYQELKGGGDAD